MNKIRYKVTDIEHWFFQPDVQEGGGRSVQKQTQQRAHDVPHEGKSEIFNILYHKPQIIYIFSLSTKGQL